MKITIISPTRVEIDGKDAGILVDALLAHPGERDAFANELARWHGDHVKEDQRREKELEDAKKALDVRCEEHRKEHQSRSTALSEASDFRAKEFLANVQAAAQRFLGRSDVDSTLKAKEKAELQAKLAALG